MGNGQQGCFVEEGFKVELIRHYIIHMAFFGTFLRGIFVNSSSAFRSISETVMSMMFSPILGPGIAV
jgi:hypothetical protein